MKERALALVLLLLAALLAALQVGAAQEHAPAGECEAYSSSSSRDSNCTRKVVNVTSEEELKKHLKAAVSGGEIRIINRFTVANLNISNLHGRENCSITINGLHNLELVGETGLNITNCSHLVIRKAFANHTTTGAEVVNSTHIELRELTFNRTSGPSVKITNSSSCAVVECNFDQCEGQGVIIGEDNYTEGDPDPAEITEHDNVIDRCTFSFVAQLTTPHGHSVATDEWPQTGSSAKSVSGWAQRQKAQRCPTAPSTRRRQTARGTGPRCWWQTATATRS